jgi:hypothetical protein
MMPQVHDFRLLNGGERCSVVLENDEITYVYIGEVPLTGDQWRELVQRVMETDWSEDG